jgi:hypothetical protein
MGGIMDPADVSPDLTVVHATPCVIGAEVAQAHDGCLGMVHSYIDAITATDKNDNRSDGRGGEESVRTIFYQKMLSLGSLRVSRKNSNVMGG